MFVRRFVGQSQRKGAVIFSLLLGLVFVFSAVQLLMADAGETAVRGASVQQAGAVFTDTVITEGQAVLTVTEELSGTGVVSTYTIYLPIIFQPLSISASRPNSANQWTISWEDNPAATGYMIQESKDPNFTTH